MSRTQFDTMNLSPHFTLDEAIVSQTATRLGLDNLPSFETLDVMVVVAGHMERVRLLLGGPILVSSWYRSPEVNAAVGSGPTSQHIKGEAVDFICPAYGDPFSICQHISRNVDLIHYDQLIFEGSWVHISFCGIPGSIPRKEVLTYMKNRTYIRGLHESRE